MATAHELVARGAELLDEKLPGWADQIDLDTLELRDTCACVLGQIGCHVFNLDKAAIVTEPNSPYTRMHERLDIEPGAYGFNETWADPYDDDSLITFDELQDAWKGEVVARRTL